MRAKINPWHLKRVELTLSELADFVDGQILRGDSELRLTGFSSLEQCAEGDVAFFALEGYRAHLQETKASAVLVYSDFEDSKVSPDVALIAVEEPTLAFSKLVEEFSPSPPQFEPGVHPGAHVHPTAEIGENVVVQPGAVVCAETKIGDRTILGPGSYVGERAELGSDCHVHANVSVAWGCVLGDRVVLSCGVVIGAEGFGYELVEGRHVKVEQLGNVILENDVDIGAGTTVDRARFGSTVIGEGTKIDNQVQIGHNCEIGKHCIIVALTGIAGSTHVGDYVTMGAQVGIAGHLRIADKVMLAARSGVTKSISEPGLYMGFPVQKAADERRQIARVRQIGSISKRVKALESIVEEIGKDSDSVD